MPLPTDQNLINLSNEIIAQFDALFNLHPGFRPAHARGIMLTGTFTPTKDAAILSSAPHFTKSEPTPVTVRFSSSTGLPDIPDTDPNANPRGVHIITLIGLIRLQFGRPLGSILPFTVDSIFSFVHSTIQSNPI
jgi:catalase